MSKLWNVAVIMDTSKPMLGLHGLHTAFRGLPNVEVVAHVDANTDDLENKLAQTRAKRHYTTLPDMLSNEEPDIVVICSRHPGDHLEQIRQAAENGCHLYCEKPLSVFLEEADEISHIVESNGIKLAIAHPARHDLAFRMLKQKVEAGDIGKPLKAIGLGKCDHRGGGEDLVVLGTHILDIMTFIFGSPESVTAQVHMKGRLATLEDCSKTVEPIGPALGDEVFASFCFPNAVQCTFQSRRGLLKHNPITPYMGLAVQGTEGTLSLRFDDFARQPLLVSRQSGPLERITDYMVVPLVEERGIAGAEPLDYSLCGQPNVPRAPWFLEANRFAAWDLLKAIEEYRQPQSNIENARTVVEMIQGIYSAHLLAASIDLPLACRKHPLANNLI